MYAIVKTGGKQYKVAPGDKLNVEKLDAEVGSKVELTAICIVDGDKVEADPAKAAATKVTATVIEQFRRAGVTAPMISGDGWDTDLWGVAGDLANQDIYACTHYSADDTSDVVQNFISAYTEEYGTAPENAFAALGYDSAQVIFKAIEMCGDDLFVPHYSAPPSTATLSNFCSIFASVMSTEGGYTPSAVCTSSTR